jgi:hypothetical protein
MCRVSEMIEVSITLHGQPVTMHACSACDTRWWDSEGEQIAIQKIYDLVKADVSDAKSARG